MPQQPTKNSIMVPTYGRSIPNWGPGGICDSEREYFEWIWLVPNETLLNP